MKVALIQLMVEEKKEDNIANASKFIAEAAKQGADVVMLPEMFSCPYTTSNFPIYAEDEGGESQQKLSQCAKENGVYIVAGSLPENEDGKTYNTSYVFDRTGRKIAKHRKVHLFDIDVVGGQRFFESETLTAGNQITTFDTEFGKMGLAICFDFRFSEMSRIMAADGAKVIFVPAAFNMTTGPAHWELLFRSRALDNQVFTVGTAPARNMNSSYHSYGNSIVVSPWGDVVARLDEKEAILYYDINLEKIDEVRAQLPTTKAARFDVYQPTKRR